MQSIAGREVYIVDSPGRQRERKRVWRIYTAAEQEKNVICAESSRNQSGVLNEYIYKNCLSICI